jgi:hypothetical protein
VACGAKAWLVTLPQVAPGGTCTVPEAASLTVPGQCSLDAVAVPSGSNVAIPGKGNDQMWDSGVSGRVDLAYAIGADEPVQAGSTCRTLVNVLCAKHDYPGTKHRQRQESVATHSATCLSMGSSSLP